MGPTPSCLVSNPINIATGNKFQLETDYQGGGRFPLVLERYYNSDTRGWQHSFNYHVNFYEVKRGFIAKVQRPNGRVYTYTSIDGSRYSWKGDPDVVGKLERVLGVGEYVGWRYINARGFVEEYDEQGRITRITRQDGAYQTFRYENDSLIAEDENGHILELVTADNQLLYLITPEGQRYGYSYDEQGNLVSVTYPDDQTDVSIRHYHYEDERFPRALTGITDERGERYATWAYDEEGRAILSEHAEGADGFKVSYNADGTVKTVGALGEELTYSFTELYGLKRITQIQRQVGDHASTTHYHYDANGFLSQAQDYTGIVTQYQYNDRGLQTSRTEATGTVEERTIATEWNSTLRVPKLITEPDKTTAFTYDTVGRVLTKKETDKASGQQRTWTYSYNEQGLLATAKGPRTDVDDTTKYAYNEQHLLSEVTNALGHVSHITAYNAQGLPLTLVDGNGVTTELAYHPRGWLISRTVKSSSGDLVTRFTYDDAGLLTHMALPTGQSFTYTYDAARRLTAVTHSGSETQSYTLDALGNQTQTVLSITGQEPSYSHHQVFDELGRLLKSVGANNQTTTYGYDANGNPVTITNGLSQATQQAFDGLNRLVQSIDPDQGQVQYAYDSQDNIVSVTDQRGLVTTYQYDGFGNRVEENSPDTGITTYVYDAAGNRTQRTDANGVVQTYSYDALNRLVHTHLPASASDDVFYDYDDTTGGNKGIGRLTRIRDASGQTAYQYDDQGRVIKVGQTVAGMVYTIHYAYDGADNLKQITYPSGREVHYSLDNQGRVISMAIGQGVNAQPIITHVSYKPLGPAGHWTYGNGLVETRHYDQSYRLTGLNLPGLKNKAYAYDIVNNITEIKDQLTANNSQTFGYDSLQRLISAQGNYGSLDYVYDGVGNRHSHIHNGVTQTYSYGATNNQLMSIEQGKGGAKATRTFGYSATGQLIRDERSEGNVFDLNYDSHNRLVGVAHNTESSASYTQNGLGQRVIKVNTATGDTWHYHYDLSGRLLAESTDQGQVIREYLYRDDQLVGLISEGALYYVHTDHLGTPQLITDGSQQVVWAADYTPFGEATVTVSKIENSIRFPGQYYDGEMGTHYNYYRNYDPSLGRYIQSDPIGLEGGLNRYGYVNGNPINYIDPTGEFALNPATGAMSGFAFGGPFGAVIGAIVGGVALAVIGQNVYEMAKGGNQNKRNHWNAWADGMVKVEGGDPCSYLDKAYKSARASGNRQEARQIQTAQKAAGCRNKKKRDACS